MSFRVDGEDVKVQEETESSSSGDASLDAAIMFPLTSQIRSALKMDDAAPTRRPC